MDNALTGYSRPFIATNGAIKDAENRTVIEARECDGDVVRDIVASLNGTPRAHGWLIEARGWLIETAQNTYWDGKQTGDDANFVASANDAVRFAQFEDAEVVRCWLLEKVNRAQRLRSAEHVFIGPDRLRQSA